MSEAPFVLVAEDRKNDFALKREASGVLLSYHGGNPSALRVSVYIQRDGWREILGLASVRQWDRQTDGSWKVSVIPEGGAWPRPC
jgi:hypothetical protein